METSVVHKNGLNSQPHVPILVTFRSASKNTGASPDRMKRHLDRTDSVNSLISKVTGIFNRGVTDAQPLSFEGATLMSYSASQEIFLPTEVLLEIFKSLRRLDVEKMKTVCKYWATIARHPALGYRLAHQFIVGDAFFSEVIRIGRACS
jgi:hypothetical protein